MAYTKEEKAEALALMRTGVSAQRAAKELGLQSDRQTRSPNELRI
jgi:transposase-like protein